MVDIQKLTLKDRARFWAKVDQSGGPDECWPWTAGKYKSGYGQFGAKFDGTIVSMRAHKVAYADLVGEIPEGMTVDHTCTNILCCNPAHFDLVTDRVNIFRAHGNNWPAALHRVMALPRYALLNQTEAAFVLGFDGGSTVLGRVRKRGEIAGVRVGHRWVYLRSAMAAFVIERMVEMDAA